MLDREAFQAALFNLLINAKQAMPEGGQLVVRTRAIAAAAWRCDLIDTGVRHRRADARADVRGVLLDQAGRLRPGPADDHARSSKPTAAASRAERTGRGTKFTMRLPPTAPPRLGRGLLGTDHMGAVVKRETGLRTARRVSHCFVLDVPSHDDTLILTDAAVNIAPTLEEKVDIVQNVIDLARALNIDRCASRSCRRWRRSVPRCPRRSRPPHSARWPIAARSRAPILDGPLALDNAIDLGAAQNQEDPVPVAGQARVSWLCRTSRPVTCSPRA